MEAVSSACYEPAPGWMGVGGSGADTEREDLSQSISIVGSLHSVGDSLKGILGISGVEGLL